MRSRFTWPGSPVTISVCLMLACVAVAVLCAATAHASGYYPTLLCAANNGSGSYQTATNTISANNPGGIFSLENHCGPAGDPAGNGAFLRIAENQSGGNAGVNAYGRISWTVTPWVAIVTGGGYTREPNAFNEGWRGRFWTEGWDGSTNNILMQGYGVANGSLGGIGWGTTSTFASHLWPFSGYGDYRRFVFELTCVRPSGCDRANFNAVDANTIHLTLADRQDPSASFVSSNTVNGQWVRGETAISWNESDQGSGLRFSRLKVDGNPLSDGIIDYQANGGCDVGSSGASGEFARRFNPCPGGPYQRSYGLKTWNIADGQHSFSICLQDYGQYRSGGESCDNRTIRTDNTAPGKPASLEVTSANPARYLDRFGATFSLPPNSGSPITKVHYYVTNDGDGGKVVVPEQVVSATNPTSLSDIEGPTKAGAYTLHLAIEDQVGLLSPFASAPIPHDTTPPAAPQDLSVATPSSSRASQGFDLRWRNIVDGGSPIDAAHYEIVNDSGGVVVPTKTVAGDNIERIADLDAPRARGVYTLVLWLSDAEGNAGAPVKAPLAYNCMKADDSGGSTLTAGLGKRETGVAFLHQGEGTTLGGKLGGAHANVPICVFSQVVTAEEREFIGVALTNRNGSYRFSVPAGPSRELTVAYRPGQRELTAQATVRTKVRPSFRLIRKVVRNQGFAIFKTAIPSPRKKNVVILLQVKSGKAWRVFRRCHTRASGSCLLRYRFTQVSAPTVYIMRAQVRAQSGYPYQQGSSKARRLRVVPETSRARKAR